MMSSDRRSVGRSERLTHVWGDLIASSTFLKVVGDDFAVCWLAALYFPIRQRPKTNDPVTKFQLRRVVDCSRARAV
jgi:hypothetical protein